MSQYSSEIGWRPLIQSRKSIRNLIFEGNVEYFESGSTGKIETRAGSLTTGILFQNQTSINLTLSNTFDRLVNPIRIQRISIPAGDYEYMDYSARFATNTSETVSGSGNLTWGQFWNGRRRSFTGGLNLKPSYRVNLDLTYSRNRIELADGRADSNLVGARIVYGFNPRSFFNVYVQYNGSTHEVSTNVRFNIMYRPLSDLYLVYNDRRNTQTNEPQERAFIVKLTNLFNF
jgi:hypothetical protein